MEREKQNKTNKQKKFTFRHCACTVHTQAQQQPVCLAVNEAVKLYSELNVSETV